MDLKDKVALVTGGAQGIGEAIAGGLASKGAKLVLADVNLEKTEMTAKTMAEQYQVDVVPLKMDVSNFKEVEEGIKKIIDKYGRLDILVNNAGVTRDGLMMRMSDADWDLVLAINLKGTFNCIKAATRPMMKQRYGRVINIASVVGLMGNAGQANYSASKAGVIGLTKTSAKELASRKITVNAIAPGFIKTKMTEALTDEAKDGLKKMIPLGALGEPADVARAVIFLASDDAAYITGQVLAVDGGMVMH
ncbi:3-oxoacyl-[acyl-carrier-protein] reductase [bacterium]|nr:3-oxoacyl-[acyl-carrier-protein] reductase [bacterium]